MNNGALRISRAIADGTGIFLGYTIRNDYPSTVFLWHDGSIMRFPCYETEEFNQIRFKHGFWRSFRDASQFLDGYMVVKETDTKPGMNEDTVSKVIQRMADAQKLQWMVISTYLTEGKISAIKKFRGITGLDLKTSKERVDNIMMLCGIHKPDGL